MNFSIEIGPKTNLDTLPALKDVYITMLPGGDFKETAQQAVNLVKKGFNPVPHFPARSMANEAQLKEYVTMCKDGGVKQALVIGGGRDPLVPLEKMKMLSKIISTDEQTHVINNAGHFVPEWGMEFGEELFESLKNE